MLGFVFRRKRGYFFFSFIIIKIKYFSKVFMCRYYCVYFVREDFVILFYVSYFFIGKFNVYVCYGVGKIGY